MKVRFSKNDVLLILGALRRAFSRSDIHKRVKEAHRVEHEDPKRPRCKKWSWCASCGEVVPEWTTDVDHRVPISPVDRYTYELDPHEILDRIWCQEDNLDNLCQVCHDRKSEKERAAKREYRKGLKNGKRNG